jgi:protein-L-isoaspartate(D-aspartate) O-methyltransferase
MGTEQNFLQTIHNKTARNYERVSLAEKPACARVAKQFGFDYWDGDRKHGFGGYSYDGRWAPMAKRIVDHYELSPKSRILDIGCGKAFLLYEIQKLVPGISVAGIDVSEYGIATAKEEVRPSLRLGKAQKLEFETKSFDFVMSVMTLHNLYLFELADALKEISRVGKGPAYIAVEAYRTEEEKANLLSWQLTCESFFTPQEWTWAFDHFGYQGDFEFVYFE